ncbi:MAG: hypothetical protein R3D67_05980 [Hyphomicrobiaceae bacterium]
MKTRYIAGSQQLLRVDQEETRPVTAQTEVALLEATKRLISHADIVALSDYAKGVLTNNVLRGVLAMARQEGKPTIVDPKRLGCSLPWRQHHKAEPF